MLGNFGGNTGYYGAIPDIREGFENALNYPNSSLAGTGKGKIFLPLILILIEYNKNETKFFYEIYSLF